MAKSTIRQNQDYILEFYKHCDSRQIMDVGKSIPEGFEARGKALGLIHIMKKFPVGYKVDYAELVSRKWKNWIKEDPHFTAKDVLSANDVKNAIRGFYAMVDRGELQVKEGTPKKMLAFEMLSSGRLILKVVPFLEVFKIVPAKDEGEGGSKKEFALPKGVGILDALNACLKAKGLSEAGTEVIQGAISEWKKLKGSVVVKK